MANTPSPSRVERPALPTVLASNVSYRYRSRRPSDDRHAVRDVDLEILPGTLTGLLGSNGSGKTTLLKLLTGVLRADTGQVTLHGRPLAGLSRRSVARQIAVVPQETHPAFEFTALEIVLMGRHPHLGAFQLEGPGDLAIAEDALASTGTSHLAARPFDTLSGGEKQRVVIAAALAQASDVLLLDEPTASLDLRYQLEIASLLRTLNRDRGVTMVIATHDLNLACSLCDTLVLMRDGQVIAHGPTADVLTPDAIRRVFNVHADVGFHQRAGHLTVVPWDLDRDGRHGAR